MAAAQIALWPMAESAKAAQPTPQASEGAALALTDEERSALICAAMAHGIELLTAAERQNLAGAFDASDALRASALALIRAELKLRGH